MGQLLLQGQVEQAHLGGTVRLPERLRWVVEKVVHDPDKPPAPKPVKPAPEPKDDAEEGPPIEEDIPPKAEPKASAPPATATPTPRQQ